MASEQKIKVRVLRGFWPTENPMDRVFAGAIIEVDTETLINGLEKGILERVKDAK